MLEINKIYNGDCLEVMGKFPDNSIDHILSDPPYNLDTTLKRFSKSNLENENYIKKQIEAGGTVFSRSSKGFMGKTWDVLPSQEIFNEMYRVIKPAGFCFLLMTPRQDSLWRVMARLEEAGFNINFSSLYYVYGTGFPKSSNTSKSIDKRLCAEGEVVEKHKNPAESKGNIFSLNQECNITVPATPQAKYFDGYGTMSLKPAVEIVIVAMKPISEKTYIDQALAYYEQKVNGNNETDINKGCVDIDGCRLLIEDTDNNLRLNAKNHNIKPSNCTSYDLNKDLMVENRVSDNGYHSTKGRFPANIITTDGALDDGENKQPTVRNSSKSKKGNAIIFNQGENDKDRFGGFPDSGSFDRFFSIDKWFENKLKELPPAIRKTFPCLIVPKPTAEEKNAGVQADTNKHCTVKPIKLMIYLIQLMSDKNDIILDPFVGSGTTCIACRMQQRRYIGIERDAEYYKIAQARLDKEVSETLF